MRRIRPLLGALSLVLALAACGSARTELPASVPPGPPLQTTPVEPTTLATTPEPAADPSSAPGP